MADTLKILIKDKLKELFPNSEIHRENIQGAFIERSFHIVRVTSKPIPKLFDFQKVTYHYQIIYFAAKENPREDMDEVTDVLTVGFRYLKGFGLLQNRNFEPLVNDDGAELHFTFDLEVHLRADEVPKFDENNNIDYNGGLKNGE
jgi:hypothetical protein